MPSGDTRSFAPGSEGCEFHLNNPLANLLSKAGQQQWAAHSVPGDRSHVVENGVDFPGAMGRARNVPAAGRRCGRRPPS